MASSAVTRDEYDEMSARITALEDSRATDPDSSSGDDLRHLLGSEYVRQDEFRLFKWLGTFALAAILGGFTLLYEQTSDLRVATERLHTELLREMHAQHAAIGDELAGVRERVVRIETVIDDKTP